VDQIITYVDALFVVFTILVLIRVLFSFFPTRPVQPFLRSLYDFIEQSTDWYLNIFRRFIPPLGMFDLSPMVALLVLFVLNSLITSVLQGF
jgi:YggT family protein